MRVIRVFPRKTSFTPKDDYVFVGEPPLMRPEANEVHISVTFTWDKEKAERLKLSWQQYYSVVKLGGPVYSRHCNGFMPGQYVRDGVTFTSRGCNYNCPWCLVEGKLREMDFWSGHIIQDDNILQCSSKHLNRVFEMLKGQRAIEFSGGLDADLVTSKIADDLRSLRIQALFLACDTKGAIKSLRRAVDNLSAFSRDKIRCYVLLAFNGESISDATARLEDVWAAGCMPFAQLYQPPDRYINYPKEWKDLARVWSRPAITKAIHLMS